MYVCLCYGVTADEIHRNIRSGAGLQELKDQTCAGTCCGCCVDEIADMVECHKCEVAESTERNT